MGKIRLVRHAAGAEDDTHQSLAGSLGNFERAGILKLARQINCRSGDDVRPGELLHHYGAMLELIRFQGSPNSGFNSRDFLSRHENTPYLRDDDVSATPNLIVSVKRRILDDVNVEILTRQDHVFTRVPVRRLRLSTEIVKLPLGLLDARFPILDFDLRLLGFFVIVHRRLDGETLLGRSEFRFRIPKLPFQGLLLFRNALLLLRRVLHGDSLAPHYLLDRMGIDSLVQRGDGGRLCARPKHQQEAGGVRNEGRYSKDDFFSAKHESRAF